MLSITYDSFFLCSHKLLHLEKRRKCDILKNLKKLRLRKGLSQQRLADIIGVSQQSVNKYENHSIEPDMDTLISLANFFHTSVDYLVGHTDIDHIIEKVNHYDLNQDEARLLDGYRKLTDAEKESIQLVIDNYNKKENSDS